MKKRLPTIIAALLLTTAIKPCQGATLVEMLFTGSAEPGATTYGSARIEAGVLKLTDALEGQNGSFIIDPLEPGQPVTNFVATFKVRVGGSTTPARPADGFSFAFGPDLPDGPFPAGEEGAGSGLRITFDTYDNGGADAAPAIEVFRGATSVAVQSMAGVRDASRPPVTPLLTDPATGQPMSIRTDDAYAEVRIILDEDGTLDLDFKGVRIFNNVGTGYQPVAGRFGLGARTGGANDNHWVDDLRIDISPRLSPAVLIDPFTVAPLSGRAVHGSARVDAGALKLTDAAASQNGSCIFEELVSGQLVTSFTVTFNVRVGGSTTPERPADGFSFVFGPDLPNGPFPAGEEGAGGGLRITFDTYDNGGADTAPAMEVFYGRGSVAVQSMAGIRDSSRPPVTPLIIDPATGQPMSIRTEDAFVGVCIRLDADGTLDLDYKGVRIFNDIPTGYTPVAGRFGLGARTGGANDNHWVDDLRIVLGPPDRTPPVIQCPSNVTVWTCSRTGAVANYPAPVATDNQDPEPAVTCVPAPGSTFPLGVTTVACSATDDCNNRGTCTFTVTVNADTTPPDITCPSNIVFNCLCPGQVIVLDFFQATATDNQDPSPTVVCNPPSLVSSPGVHVVTCTATDDCGNSSQCQFTVTFNYDATPPVLTCPTNFTVLTCTNFAVVHYSVGATDDCDAAVTVVCAPPSGSVFPVGVTTVNCVATNDCGQTVRCSFEVTVRVSMPRLTLVAVAGGLELSWPDGAGLDEADSVTGPWRVDPDARSPYRVSMTRAQRFFRLAIRDEGNETTAFCPSAEESNPRLTDVLSRMHYASRRGTEEIEETEDIAEYPRTISFPPRDTPYDPRPGEGYSWNSDIGRRLLLAIGDVGADPEGAASHSRGSVEQQILLEVETPACVTPDYYVEAGDRDFDGWPESNGVVTAVFKAPKNAFATKAEAEAFLLKVHAEQPFFLPFTDPNVNLGHGWFYNTDGLHRACDYSRGNVQENEDPTFLVTSAGSGIVVATDWDANGGNYVAVEHTAPGGQKVMFIYLHLRDGRSHDVAKAKSSTSLDDKYVVYRAFANGWPNHLSWGTDNHTIKVKVGDPVSVGTPLAWAGNTGAGGAYKGLNPDGSPESWKGNLHLHVYVAVPHPTLQNTWVWVDPYGVYGQEETGCYELLKDTKFSRLYAPFYPTFHGVPYEVFKFYWGYYPDMGMKLRTLSIHRDGNSLLASGSFQSGIAGGWYLHTYKSLADFQDLATEHYAQGYIMRETTVEKTLGGQPRFSGIWRPLEPGEMIEHQGVLTDAQWSALWQERVVKDEWRLEDYFGYSVGGVNYQLAFVTSYQGRPFLFSGLLSSSDFDDKIDEYKGNGFLPVSFNAASRTTGLRFSGIFRDLPGCWKVAWGLTPAGYQTYVSQQLQLGYRVWKVQGYSDSNRYGVVLHDPTGPCQ